MRESIKGFLWDWYVRGVSCFWDIKSLIIKRPFKTGPRIVIYHHIPQDAISSFESQLQYYANNYQVVSLPELIRRVASPEGLGENLLAVTFDDAYKSVYQLAAPLLDKYNIKPCVFVPIGFIDAQDKAGYIKNNMACDTIADSMSWEEIADLAERGYQIGSHSFSHADFGQDGVDYKYELSGSREFLKKKLGVGIDYFAFPFGRMTNISQRAIEAGRDFGYNKVFSGLRAPISGNSYLLPRTYINPAWSQRLLKYTIWGYFDKEEESYE